MNWKVFVAVVLLPAVASAQTPPIQTIPAGDDKIEPVHKGQPAPFDGQLYDSMTALRWANWLQQYKYRLVWDVEKSQSVCSVEKRYRDELLKAEETRATTVEKDLRERLARSEQARLKAEEEARKKAEEEAKARAKEDEKAEAQAKERADLEALKAQTAEARAKRGAEKARETEALRPSDMDLVDRLYSHLKRMHKHS